MLHVPSGGLNFGALQSNNSGRPAAAQGTSVTPAVGSKGAWAQVIAALSADCFGLLICINSNSASAASRNSVVDIGIGGAGSEIVLIPNLIGGNAVAYNGVGGGLWHYFPVAIPAGTRVAVRAQGSVVTAFSVFVQAMQEPGAADQKVASFVEAIGMTLPQGTAVTAGTTAEGAWTLLGTTTKACWWWQIGAQVSSADITHNTCTYHLDLAEGDGANYRVLMDSVVFSTSQTETAALSAALLGSEGPVPAGRNIYARAQGSGTVDPLFITAYGAGG